MPDDVLRESGNAPDAWTVCRDALNEKWKAEAYAADVVHWMFEALDEVEDETVPRDDDARERAIVMANMVFADLGDDMDNGALVSNVLRAARAEK